ncbi:efflux RND transporter periplasmic adaptor subunit [Pedobacter sp. R20-19]|uniref:efflux RND transporter periplasmic adaptor subunit n=1 Tax=Pedobacter sp. R20-19 TaxID=1270196 RepID=UPI0004936E37|nr:efflux RND transporter periplasmic adaptor subunit [Pedobacter sp. R20-19]
MNRINYLITGASFAILSGIVGCSSKKENKATQDTINVKVIQLGSAAGDNAQSIVYNGTLQANKSIDLSFQVSGTIKSLAVQPGDFVKKGQLVAAIDETTYRSQYQAQAAQAKLAEENYKRTRTVFEKGSIAEIKMLEAKSNFDQAAAMAKATYQNIAHTKLYAPESGYIGEKNAEVGATASPGQPILKLLDTRSVEVLVSVPENEVNRYQTGDKATVRIEALNNEELEGRISEIGVLSLNNSANYNLKVKLDNPNQKLRPGMLSKVVFNSKSHHDHAGSSEIVVPFQAVQVDEKGNQYVYVAGSDNKAKRKQVKTGELYINGMAIKSGLESNERLITSGFQKLTDQSPIAISK